MKVITRKVAAPKVTTAYGSSSDSYFDGFKRKWLPSNSALIQEYKKTVYTCANLNANAVANVGLKLYIKTETGKKSILQKGYHTRQLSKAKIDGLSSMPSLQKTLRSYINIEEVVIHPALDLLSKVNTSPLLNNFELVIHTQLYQEITGLAYWLIDTDPIFGIPRNIWLLPTQYVEPVKESENKKIVDYYEYNPPGAVKPIQYKPEDIVVFKMPSLTNPYIEGKGFLQAAFESNLVNTKSMSLIQGLLDNEGRPDYVIAPKGDNTFGEAEALRYEQQLKIRFGRGRQGGFFVLPDDVTLSALQIPARDLARLEIEKWSKNDISNAAGIPFALIADASHNRQQLEAAEVQHARHGVLPRCNRNSCVFNDQLLTRYDQSGLLFFAYDDPVPENKEQKLQEVVQYVMNGIWTPNEGRDEIGYPPIEGGDELRAINVSPEIMRDNQRKNGSAEK